MSKICADRCYLVMSLGSERDDVWGEDESQEQGTLLVLDLQVVFPRDSLVKLQVLPLVVSLQLLRTRGVLHLYTAFVAMK